MQLEYRPPLRPHFGDQIERLIGTVMKAMHLLPGTTFSSIKERGEYDSQGKAVMTLRELETWLVLQITGGYHLTVHRALRARANRRLDEPCKSRTCSSSNGARTFLHRLFTIRASADSARWHTTIAHSLLG